ncbi:MAG: glycine betaine ABC transporter substrate-binding protein [Ignavibacteriota bacterium]
MVQGSIDLYPEYTGTRAGSRVEEGAEYRCGRGIRGSARGISLTVEVRVDAAPRVNNTFAMMVRGEMARAEKLTTLSDAARAHGWRLGVGSEFQNRVDGLPGLMKAYGLRLDAQPVNMDLGLLYAALDSRRVDMIAAQFHRRQAAVRDVTILDDDRHYFAPYDARWWFAKMRWRNMAVCVALSSNFPGN